MKKLLAIVLTLAMLLPTVLSLGAVAGAEDFTAKPYYGLGWSDINRIKFPNLEGLTIVGLKIVDQENKKLGLTYANKTDPKEIAASIKKTLDRNPEGMRYLFLAGTAQAFYVDPEDAIFMDNGVAQMKALFTELINEYKRLGGQLDGFVLDTEYVWLGSWYIYSKFYYRDNKVINDNIYNEIVANPKYATQIRPLLVERGFTFYEEVGGVKSEIYSIWPRLSGAEATKYAASQGVWNTVMNIHMANYLNSALFEPLIACYPNALMSDYQEDDMAAWLKSLSDTGEIRGYYGGNGVKMGNASNYNTYSSRPADSFFKDANGTYLYKNLPAFNNAVYENDPYHMFLFDANKFKQMYAATDNKRITAWLAEYDYGESKNSVANTPYYTETIYHIGLLNPEPFLLYIYSGNAAFKGENGIAEYNKRMQTVSEILNELTRLVGYSDRTPIETPASWNDGFVLSGMYAGGRNVWRLTPDTTEGMTLENFKVKDKAPTFTINGNTVVFPQGRIIEDGPVSVVGSSGYWIETPKDVMPVITHEADRYSKYPSFADDFSDYEEGSVFNDLNARPHQTWEIASTSDLLIQGGQLVLTGTADMKNVTIPQNITAGDTYAKQQAWEISFTLHEAMNAGSSVKLLNTATDGGIKLEGGKVYYDENGTYKELEGVTLNAGQKYTVKRDVNFAVEGAYTTGYSIYSGGSLLKQVGGVSMTGELPIAMIGISSVGLTTKVMLDDYKLYSTGLAKDFELYNGENGVRLNTTAKNSAKSVAYRLSWMNATDAGKKFNVKAAYYNSNDVLVSESVIKTVEMAPGVDGIEIGMVQNTTGGKVVVYLEDAGEYTPSQLPDYDNGNFNWTIGDSVPTEPPVSEPTTAPTVVPTAAPTTAPSVAPTAAPTQAPTAAPTQAPTAAPTGATEATVPSETKAPTEPTNTQKPVEDTDDNTGMIVVIAIVVLVLAGAGVGVFFFLKKKKQST